MVHMDGTLTHRWHQLLDGPTGNRLQATDSPHPCTHHLPTQGTRTAGMTWGMAGGRGYKTFPVGGRGGRGCGGRCGGECLRPARATATERGEEGEGELPP